MSDGPEFDIPVRPERSVDGTRVTRRGRVIFRLVPSRHECSIGRAVDRVLRSDRYVYGDWFDLPRPVYLVRDLERETVFRAVVAEGSVELHVLPTTKSSGLRAFYDRLTEQSATEWTVNRHIDPP